MSAGCINSYIRYSIVEYQYRSDQKSSELSCMYIVELYIYSLIHVYLYICKIGVEYPCRQLDDRRSFVV